jgi:hypothetical protein
LEFARRQFLNRNALPAGIYGFKHFDPLAQSE